MDIRVRAKAGAVAAVLAASGLVAVPAVDAVRAVVSYDDPAALRRGGVRVEADWPNVGAAAVTGTPARLSALSRVPGVRAVTPDTPMSPTSAAAPVSEDAVFSWQRLGGGAGRPGAGAGVTVAVVDTGVTDTPALDRASGRLVDGIDTSGAGTFSDGYGHGTFMAGILAGGPVAGTGSHALGVAPGATVVNVKVAGGSGTTSLSKVLAGLDWVVANRDAHSIDVLSFSFSAARPGAGYGADPLTDAVEAVREAGVVPVVSAGNVPGEVGDPGFDPRVLTVGAADTRDGRPRVAPFSGGAVVAGVTKPDVVAAGVGVLSVLPPSSVIAQENPAARRSELLWRGSGTSEATATTAGAVALFLADFPGATVRQVKASIRAAATNVAGEHAGAGLLRVPHRLRDGADEPGAGDGGGDGEGGFDANSWGANSWGANTWGANTWGANTWGANTWGANTWGANSWSGRWGADE